MLTDIRQNEFWSLTLNILDEVDSGLLESDKNPKVAIDQWDSPKWSFSFSHTTDHTTGHNRFSP